MGTLAAAASIATIVGGVAAVGGAAYSIANQPKAPRATPAIVPLPPSASTATGGPASAATLSNPAIAQTAAANRARTSAAGANQSGTVGAAGIQGLNQPLSTAKSTLLGGTSSS